MTAPIPESSAHADPPATTADEIVVGHVGRVCHTAAEGRRSARALAQWCERFQLSEPEFQVMWCLRGLIGGGLDQTTLAKRLALSPAQVSGTVEKLRARGWISQQSVDGDRRRHLWHLSESGGGAIHEMLRVAHELRIDPLILSEHFASVVPEREAAA